MGNLCCSCCVKKQRISGDYSELNLTLLLPWIFLQLTLWLLFTVKIINCENISLLKVKSGNKKAMLNFY